MKLTLYKFQSYPLNLYSLVFSREISEQELPPDWEESLSHVYCTLTSYEKSAMVRYFKDGLPTELIGAEFNLSGEGVRQIITKAIRKLRNPSRSKFLLQGKAAVEKVREDAAKLSTKQKQTQTDEIQTGVELNRSDFSILDLNTRAVNCLLRRGITTVEDLLTCSESDLHSISNLGKRTISHIKECLSAYGLSLRLDPETDVQITGKVSVQASCKADQRKLSEFNNKPLKLYIRKLEQELSQTKSQLIAANQEIENLNQLLLSFACQVQEQDIKIQELMSST